jgi:hypothetical protein
MAGNYAVFSWDATLENLGVQLIPVYTAKIASNLKSV